MTTVKSYYDLLGVLPQASVEEIKRAFRREISRYHPDKVQHLGQEFQELAANRAAELTHAYRMLTGAGSREAYDEDLRQGGGAVRVAAPPSAPPPPRDAQDAPPPPPPPPEAELSGARPPREPAGDQVVRRAVLARFKKALIRTFGEIETSTTRGFDLSVTHKPKRGLFKKQEPDLRLLAKFVPVVDAGAVNEAYPAAVRAKPTAESPVCVFLMGTGFAPKAELAQAIEANRRHARGPVHGLALVPLDVRIWEALIPTGAPPAVRTIIEKLQKPE